LNHSLKPALLCLCLALAACSSLDSDKINYKSAGKAPALDVPPDLTQLTRDTRYTVPGTPVTASSYQSGQPSQNASMAPNSAGDVRIERAGAQRWLVVNRPAEKIWGEVKDFWLESGFLIATEQSQVGIMETDWAENRAKLPQDFIRAALGRALDTFYSTGERDKFRTRLERTASGDTEIYIAHRGMVEVYSDASTSQTVWQPRATDTELEIELLRRLMLKLGVSQEQSKALVAANAPKLSSRLVDLDGQPVVQMDEGFDRAWRRVGLTLDRTGFTVEDRDRSQGVYFVRYVQPNLDKTEPGLFSKMFGSAPTSNDPQKYRIVLKAAADTTTVSVLNAGGAPETSENARNILRVITDDLK
jgi:outer membrane protein assembly factor BamC